MNSEPILLCFAVRQEARFFSAPEPVRESVEVLITGMGRKNAAESVERALDQSKPELVLTCGFAGGLKPSLRVGSVIFSADAEAEVSTTLTQIGATPARFHCSTKVISKSADKLALLRDTGADAVDMESEVIRQLCRTRNVPSATIRAVSDTVDQDLPLDFDSLLTDQFEIDGLKLTLALLRAPWRIPALLELRKQVNDSAMILAGILQELLWRRHSGR